MAFLPTRNRSADTQRANRGLVSHGSNDTLELLPLGTNGSDEHFHSSARARIMTRPAIAFVEGNTSGTGIMFFRSAFALGLQPVLLSQDPSRYEIHTTPEVRVIQCNTSSIDELVEVCRPLQRSADLKGVWSSSEYFIATSATLANLFGLPGPNHAAVTQTRNKKLQRDLTKPLYKTPPRSVLAGTPDEINAAALSVGLPVILKPVSGSGSLGVRLCASTDAIDDYVAKIADGQSSKPHITSGILVEEYLSGAEFSVELFDGRSIGVTRKHLGLLPSFVEIGHDFPLSFDESSEPILRRFAERVTEALGLTWGPAHVEVRLRDGEPVLIEANPRLAGGHIPTLVLSSLGPDLIEATILRAIGQQISVHATPQRCASIRFLLRGNSIWSPDNDALSKARSLPGIIDAQLYPNASTVSDCLHGDFRDRIGHVIATGRTLEDSARAADRAILKLNSPEMGYQNA